MLTSTRPRLAVICVDGATPGVTRALGLFETVDSEPVARLRSIYPSSTAPAHASLLTGAWPEAHGIVANRFWAQESVPVIRASQAPLAALHPYERSSLRAPSLLDQVLGDGLRVGAVLFPHAFAREGRDPGLESAYCLYASSRRHRVRLRSGDRSGGIATELFGHRVEIAVLGSRDKPAGSVVGIRVGGVDHDLRVGESADVVLVLDAEKAVTFALRVDALDDDHVVLAQGTAVLVLAEGERRAREWVAGSAVPHSRGVDYTANPEHDFHESPTVEWVTERALDLAADGPDVLLVRYSQVDHAQEFLYAQSIGPDGGVRAAATAQIASVYRRVAAGVGSIVAAVGPRCAVVVLSDHGIDDIDTFVSPNTLLERMGLSPEFVFQGDSHLCYLYGDRPLTQRERTDLVELLDAGAERKLRVLDAHGLRERRVHHTGRCGLLALESPRHWEFQYGSDGDLCTEVSAASHGCNPAHPAMDGIWTVLQGPALPRPAGLVEVAGTLRVAVTRVDRP